MAAAVSLVLSPVQEMVTIEVVIFSFAALYGFGVWPVVPTAASVAVFGVFAAAVMVPRTMQGELPAVELIEVVAPMTLAGIVMFHVRRRVQAVDRANRLAEADRRRAAARDRLSRMTSHELRTPLTIAGGYVEHLLADERDDLRREDLLTVRDELFQLGRVSERLVRAVSLDLGAPEDSTDVCAMLEEVRRRWSGIVDRDLVVDSRVHLVPVNGERLRAALDTLVENSVRYTDDGDRICLFSALVDGHAEVGVADSGSGLSRRAHLPHRERCRRAPGRGGHHPRRRRRLAAAAGHVLPHRLRAATRRRHRPDGRGLGGCVEIGVRRRARGDRRSCPAGGGRRHPGAWSAPGRHRYLRSSVRVTVCVRPGELPVTTTE